MVDLGLPEMSGDQIALQLRRSDPAISTVLMSGWELSQADPKLAIFDFQLQKPLDDLETVNEVLKRAVALHDSRMSAVE